MRNIYKIQIYFKNFFLINLKNIISIYLEDILVSFSDSDLKEENTLNYKYSQFKRTSRRNIHT